MSEPRSAVLDHTALVALGAGNRRVSALVAAAHRERGRYVFAPALCLAAAVAQRSGPANHLGVLPVVHLVDLDFVSSTAVGSLVADGVPWQAAQAVDAGRPSAEWPTGRPVVTGASDLYGGLGVQVIAL